MRLGLLRTCVFPHDGDEVCYNPQELPAEWIVAVVLILSGCLAVTTSIIFIIVANWDRSVNKYAKWSGFIAGTYN